jgi:RNA-directed DNA polymerase
MMNGQEKSDPAIVAVKPTNKAERSGWRSRWSQGRGPRGMRTSKARAGRRTGKPCHRRWNAYGKPQGKGRRRSSPRSCTTSASIFWRRRSLNQGRTPPPGRRRDVAGLRGDLEGNLADLHERVHRGAYRATPSPAGHPQAGRRSARWRSPRWRTRSSSAPSVAVLNAIYEEDFLGFSLRVPARARPHDALDALSSGSTAPR